MKWLGMPYLFPTKLDFLLLPSASQYNDSMSGSEAGRCCQENSTSICPAVPCRFRANYRAWSIQFSASKRLKHNPPSDAIDQVGDWIGELPSLLMDETPTVLVDTPCLRLWQLLFHPITQLWHGLLLGARNENVLKPQTLGECHGMLTMKKCSDEN